MMRSLCRVTTRTACSDSSAGCSASSPCEIFFGRFHQCQLLRKRSDENKRAIFQINCHNTGTHSSRCQLGDRFRILAGQRRRSISTSVSTSTSTGQFWPHSGRERRAARDQRVPRCVRAPAAAVRCRHSVATTLLSPGQRGKRHRRPRWAGERDLPAAVLLGADGWLHLSAANLGIRHPGGQLEAPRIRGDRYCNCARRCRPGQLDSRMDVDRSRSRRFITSSAAAIAAGVLLLPRRWPHPVGRHNDGARVVQGGD